MWRGASRLPLAAVPEAAGSALHCRVHEKTSKYTGLGEEPQVHTSLSDLEGVLRGCCVLTGLQAPAVRHTTAACPRPAARDELRAARI